MSDLTTKQASEILGVSRRRVIALIEQGKLKARKFSNVYAEPSARGARPAAVRERKGGRPEGSESSADEKPFRTIFDIAPDLIGCIKDGLPTDLSTNKKYLEGLGSKAAEKASLKRRQSKKR